MIDLAVIGKHVEDCNFKVLSVKGQIFLQTGTNEKIYEGI